LDELLRQQQQWDGDGVTNWSIVNTSAADGGTPHPAAGESDGEKENMGFFALVEVKKEAKLKKRNEFVPQRARFWLTKDPALNVKNGVAIFEKEVKYKVVLKRNTTGTAETYCLWGEDIELAYGEEFPKLDVTSTTIRKQDLKEGAFLRGAHLRELGNAQLKGANLESANLQGANLWLADLRGADLCNATLQAANLLQAKMEGANLKYANLQGAYTHKADLRRSILCDGHLQGANFSEADLSDANLSGADLTSLRGAGLALVQGIEEEKSAANPAARDMEPRPTNLRMCRLSSLTKFDNTKFNKELNFSSIKFLGVNISKDSWNLNKRPTQEGPKISPKEALGIVLPRRPAPHCSSLVNKSKNKYRLLRWLFIVGADAAYRAAQEQEGDEQDEGDDDNAQEEGGKGGSSGMQQAELALMAMRLGFCMYMVSKKDRATLRAIAVVLEGLATLATGNAAPKEKEEVLETMETAVKQFTKEADAMGNEAATAVDRSLRRLPSVKRVEQEDLVKSQRNFLESFDEFKETLNSTKKGQRKRTFAESARVQQPLVRATAWLLSTALKLLTKKPGKNSGDKRTSKSRVRKSACRPYLMRSAYQWMREVQGNLTFCRTKAATICRTKAAKIFRPSKLRSAQQWMTGWSRWPMVGQSRGTGVSCATHAAAAGFVGCSRACRASVRPS
jgi:uncharacterized protein YjbI with pentapeptide repeats